MKEAGTNERVPGQAGTLHEDPRWRWTFAGGVVLLLCFSFYWTWRVGHRGLFMLDQSIVFDGAWRIHQGQVPYRDFVMPFGPTTFVLPALAFRFLGVSFSALVFTAALVSLLAAGGAVRLVLRLTGSRWLALLAGLLTAVWFQAPFGIPWMEQTAFLFDLAALLAIVEGRFTERRASAWFVAAGFASALAVLSKQNAGGLFVLVAAGACAVPWRGRTRAAVRAVLAYAVGLGSGAVGFAAWLWAYSDARAFWHYWIEVSAATGAGRLELWRLFGTLVYQPLLGSTMLPFLVGSGCAVLVWWLTRRRSPSSSFAERLALTAWCALALPQFQSAFQLTTNNDATNDNAFVGVVVACALALLSQLRRGDLTLSLRVEGTPVDVAVGRPLHWAGAGLVLAAASYSFVEGMVVANTRQVQEFGPGASFDRPMQSRGLERVRWGEPTRITPQFCANLGQSCTISADAAEADRPYEVLRQDDFERLLSRLRERRENFFVFPDATLLYGLAGRVSPQPLLYFHPGQSYALPDVPRLDAEIVTALQRHHVTLVVLERATFMGTHRLLPKFPRLHRFITGEFTFAEEFGNYRLFTARSTGASRATAASRTSDEERKFPPDGSAREGIALTKLQ